MFWAMLLYIGLHLYRHDGILVIIYYIVTLIFSKMYHHSSVNANRAPLFFMYTQIEQISWFIVTVKNPPSITFLVNSWDGNISWGEIPCSHVPPVWNPAWQYASSISDCDHVGWSIPHLEKYTIFRLKPAEIGKDHKGTAILIVRDKR